MLTDNGALLRRLVTSDDLAAELRGITDHEARARYLLRAQALERTAEALSRAGMAALLVKGAALALTRYPLPWQRPMVDIDVLVRDAEVERVCTTLAAAGLRPVRHDESRVLTGERAFFADVAGASVLVEIHTTLDKVVRRPIDHDAIFARARPAPGLEGLRIPDDADHALLVALHLAAHEFRHTIGFLDLHLLLGALDDVAALVETARAWRLEPVLYVALSSLRALGSRAFPQALLDALRPRALRRLALWSCYRLGEFPVARRPERLGWPWILRQTPLRADLGAWVLGVARYSGLRAVERLGIAGR